MVACGIGSSGGEEQKWKIHSSTLKYYSVIVIWQKCSTKSIQNKIITWRLKEEGFLERGYLNKVLVMNRQKLTC